ncbi:MULTISPECIES: pseudoazurin [unclassified Haematobacter]|uniref:pseudoazurin n=1 Tax=unclassified Haematobacter TaxID=2640585 RepID=UPI0025BD171F|nr:MULTISPECIES: pseudoazurin [unclassified Haematobacter]
MRYVKHAALMLALMAGPVLAETHDVKMYNRSENGAMIYEPSYLRIAPGDTVRFLSTQPGHNAATIDGMIPAGADPFKSRINEDFAVTLSVPGSYGIKCSPHYAMGMVMLIDVGEPAEADLPPDLPKRASERFRQILDARPDA